MHARHKHKVISPTVSAAEKVLIKLSPGVQNWTRLRPETGLDLPGASQLLCKPENGTFF
jgi:hypothetical protein